MRILPALLVLGILLLAGCVNGGSQMVAKNGDVVKVDYLGTDAATSKAFDTSIEAEAKKAGLPARESYAPLEFTVGAGQMIAGFDKAVVGMKVGDEKTVTLKPEEAYGQHDSKMVLMVDAANLSAQLGREAKMGDQILAGSGAMGFVTEIEGGSVSIDFNHPLAGKTLVFKIIMRAINATA